MDVWDDTQCMHPNVWKKLFMMTVFLFCHFSIATPLTMDMYSWTRKEAVFNNGIILSAIGIESVIAFMVVKTLAKK